MSSTALRDLVLATGRDKSSAIPVWTAAFASDFSHYARANNRSALESAVAALSNSPAHKAVKEAIRLGMLAGGLVAGYSGAKSGSFSKQSPEIQAPYLAAEKAATEAFTASLSDSDAFKAPKARTEEEKSAAKAAKAEKLESAIDAGINARIANGELVKTSDIKPVTLDTLGQSEVVDMVTTGILAGTLDPENVAQLIQALRDTGAIPPAESRKTQTAPV